MKTVITLILMLALNCNYSFADELTNVEYINQLNTFIGEMNMETDIPENSIFKILTCGVDNGYLRPEIVKLENISQSLNGLVLNIENETIENDSLQDRHNELMCKFKTIVTLLENDIESKKEILETNDNDFVKIKKILKLGKNTKVINNEITEANEIFKEINRKFSIPRNRDFYFL